VSYSSIDGMDGPAGRCAIHPTRDVGDKRGKTANWFASAERTRVEDAMLDNTKPVILIVDPEVDASRTFEELVSRYSRDYTIISAPDVAAATKRLRTLAETSKDVALILADRASDGAALLEEARTLHPHARRGLLLNWNESRSYREEIAVAFAHRQAECFVTKPSATPDERFHRSITELLDEWWRIRGPRTAAVRIVGAERTARVYEMCDLLQRHDMSFAFHPADSEVGAAILDIAGVSAGVAPVVALQDGRALVDPSNREIADALGARTRPGSGIYDVIVVGGGPAGLSAAVYAESEGLRTALIEPTAMGGQAGTSSMIRNYLGFPRGISGAELAARAFDQAILFGTEMIYGNAAAGLRVDGDLRIVQLADGTEVPGRTVVIATGVSYRTLDLPSLEPLNGVGLYYGAAISEAPALVGHEVFVVGGGNSAGQAAVHLAKFASRVTILVRSETLAQSMSDYLVTEIDGTDNIYVKYGVEVVGGAGGSRLESIDVCHRTSGAVETLPTAALFVLIGAEPCTYWLPSGVARDDWGFVMTGPSPNNPSLLQFESSVPGVFAVGDVRRDSIKRVASAAGEGAVCVRLVHQYLADR
jgi:thioredoxin reductase (NADPH)